MRRETMKNDMEQTIAKLATKRAALKAVYDERDSILLAQETELKEMLAVMQRGMNQAASVPKEADAATKAVLSEGPPAAVRVKGAA